MREIVRDPEVIEDPSNDAVHGIFEGFRFSVERRHRRKNKRAGPSKRRQIFEVDETERALPRDDDERPLFLEHHVGCAREERIGNAVGDPRRRAHRAGDHDHRVPARASAGEGRLVVATRPYRQRDLFEEISSALEGPYLRRRRRKANPHFEVVARPNPLRQVGEAHSGLPRSWFKRWRYLRSVSIVERLLTPQIAGNSI